jgi:FimV-like protein
VNQILNKIITCLAFVLIAATSFAQDVNTMLKEAENLEYKFKETEALDKYKQVLVADGNNLKALIKSAELSAAVGARLPNKKDKQLYFQSSLAFAQRALAVNANSDDANYVMAVASGKLTDVESENKKIVAYVKDVKNFSDKALAINPKHAKANYTLGKWHVEMVNLSGIKKAAVKLFYGGLPDGKIELAIQYFEKCKQYDQYFMLNYLDLAKAYIDDNKPPKAIEILKQLVKLPLRTADDAALKEEGKKLLSELQ